MKMTLEARAKINLFLDITGKRSDGYHIINTVMQSVSLCDEVSVCENDDDKIKISCSDDNVPCDETNTAYKAVVCFFEYTGLDRKGITVKIKKRIPSQAGLAGGSADAAAVLMALDQMYNAGLDKTELAEIAEKIGADVPFCIYGGTMTAGGIGTILSPLPDMPDCHIVIVKPDFSVSTKEAYQRSDLLGYDNNKSPDAVINGICNGSISELAKGLYNKFEEVSGVEEISSVKNTMKKYGALGACLSGSGSAVFGLFEEKSDAEKCRDALSDVYKNVFVVRPVSS